MADLKNPSLEEMSASYLATLEEPHPHNIHVRMTDLGKCPRQVVLRWGRAEKRPRNPLELFEKKRMFDQANFQAQRLSETLRHFHMLVGEEIDVAELMPMGVSGRLDVLVDMQAWYGWHGVHVDAGNSVWEYKSPDPRIKDENIPRTGDLMQAVGYHIAGEEVLELYYPPRLVVVVAGGKGPIHMFEIPVERFKDQTQDAIDTLLGHREKFMVDRDYLPPKMEPEVKYKGTTKIVRATCWTCNPAWCPYAYWSCRPIEEETVLAERKRVSKSNPDPQMELTDAGKAVVADVKKCIDERAAKALLKIEMTVDTPYDDWQMPDRQRPCDCGEPVESAVDNSGSAVDDDDDA